MKYFLRIEDLGTIQNKILVLYDGKQIKPEKVIYSVDLTLCCYEFAVDKLLCVICI